jgi:hypothetical protein
LRTVRTRVLYSSTLYNIVEYPAVIRKFELWYLGLTSVVFRGQQTVVVSRRKITRENHVDAPHVPRSSAHASP